MKTACCCAIAAIVLFPIFAAISRADEARLVRYPHYHNGKLAFTYMGDIWTADESGKNVQRLTAHRGRDQAPRFSPDGKWVAFSSDREGNLDVWIVPATGGTPKQLTCHSADDNVLGWSPDSKSVLFASNRSDDFLGTLYIVPLDGSAETKAGADFGLYGCFSPDGSKLAVNRKGQSYWRKGYRGSYQTDVTVVDLKSKVFRDVTSFLGMDTWPMWGSDGYIYFVSDRDEGTLSSSQAQCNFWRVPEGGGEAARITTFKDGDVRFPAMSADGKTIVFERDFRLWKLDVATRKPEAIPITINAETQDALTEYRTVNSDVDDYDVAPTGRTVVASVRGELFLVPVGEEGDLTQLTKGPARDRGVEYSPDGKLIAFVSDQESGREEIYVVPADGSGAPRRVTDIDALKNSYSWSPNSTHLAITASDGKMYRVSADGEEVKELWASKYGSIDRPAWSPDGSLLAFSMSDVTRTDDIYILPSSGGEPKKVTFDSAGDRRPAFSADGKKLYFLRTEGGDFANGERPQSNLMVIYLEKLQKDPNEPETPDANDNNSADAVGPAGPAGPRGAAGPGGARRGPDGVTNPKAPNIDWAGLKRRTRNVLRSAGGGGRGGRGGGGGGGSATSNLSITTFTPARDGRTLVFAATSGSGGPGSGATIYTCTDDGRNMRQVASASAPSTTTGDDESPRGGGGGRGFVRNLRVARGTLFYQQSNNVYSVSLGGGGGGGGPTAGPTGGRGGRGGGAPTGGSSTESATAGGGGSARRVSFNVTLTVNKPAEWREMFGDAWRTMKYRFYDPKLHGVDWEAARAKYEPIVAHVADRQELMNLINEMIGELNASHTGAAAASPQGEGNRLQTVHLGLELTPDNAAGRYKVTHVFQDGPADKDWIKVSTGDYLLAIDGQPIQATDSLWRTLNNRRLNSKVKLTLNSKPEEKDSWTVRYEPISWNTYGNLRYERWVNDRRAKVDELSGGRLGYLHIKAMDQPSLRRFEKELRENRHKEALVIDQRFNGGGNIEQELLAILVQRPYQVWQPRHTEQTDRPFRGYFGPKIVLQNWRSASNAEMFPAGFRALGLGKLVGTATMGAVIGTGSYSLIDGSTVRTPQVGVFLADRDRTNMENYGVQPDIFVDNTPEDNLATRDRQLEVAVAELIRQLPTKASPPLAVGQ
ncbi:MAG TPA: S41 family peptidase [Pirellulaceae bacterium]